MRFSLLQLMLGFTAASILCALVVHVPMARGILAAFTFGGGLALFAALAGDNRFGRWLHATLGAWIGLVLFAYLQYARPGALGSLELVEMIAATGLLACFVGTAVAVAIGRR